MASKPLKIEKSDVLIDVDVQPTFMPGGGLAVASGDAVVPVVHRLHAFFPPSRRFATLDRHPRGHVSLASSYEGLSPYASLKPIDTAGWTQEGRRGSYIPPFRGLADHALFTLLQLQTYLMRVGAQTLWPDHAIEGEPESELHHTLRPGDYAFIQVKGTDPLCDSYSGFRDNLKRETGLAQQISGRVPWAARVLLTGLAYDFCVGWTALDAVELGFEAVVVKDATRPVGLPGTIEAMEAAFAEKGVRVVESSDLSVL